MKELWRVASDVWHSWWMYHHWSRISEECKKEVRSKLNP